MTTKTEELSDLAKGLIALVTLMLWFASLCTLIACAWLAWRQDWFHAALTYIIYFFIDRAAEVGSKALKK